MAMVGVLTAPNITGGDSTGWQVLVGLGVCREAWAKLPNMVVGWMESFSIRFFRQLLYSTMSLACLAFMVAKFP